MQSEIRCEFCELINDLEHRRKELLVEFETDNVLAFRRSDVFGEIRISLISKQHVDNAIDFSRPYDDNELAKEIGKTIKHIEDRYGRSGMELYTDIARQSNHMHCSIVYNI